MLAISNKTKFFNFNEFIHKLKYVSLSFNIYKLSFDIYQDAYTIMIYIILDMIIKNKIFINISIINWIQSNLFC